MTDPTASQERPKRKRGKPIEVCVTDQEKAEISARAKEAGLSRSAFLKSSGLNHSIRSCLDLKAVQDMAEVNGD